MSLLSGLGTVATATAGVLGSEFAARYLGPIVSKLPGVTPADKSVARPQLVLAGLYVLSGMFLARKGGLLGTVGAGVAVNGALHTVSVLTKEAVDTDLRYY